MPGKVEGGAAASMESRLLLTFQSGREPCALWLESIQEVVEYHPVTRVPAAPRFVLGVFNLRGNVIPVVDLASRLGLAARPVGKRSCFIVLRVQEAEEASLVALLVDAVDQVLELRADELEPAPELGTRIGRELLCGIVRTREGLASVLDAERVLRLEGAGAGDRGGQAQHEVRA